MKPVCAQCKKRIVGPCLVVAERWTCGDCVYLQERGPTGIAVRRGKEPSTRSSRAADRQLAFEPPTEDGRPDERGGET
jgi:hypothetical protein